MTKDKEKVMKKFKCTNWNYEFKSDHIARKHTINKFDNSKSCEGEGWVLGWDTWEKEGGWEDMMGGTFGQDSALHARNHFMAPWLLL